MSNEQNSPGNAMPSGKVDPAYMNEMISFYAEKVKPVLTKLKNDLFPDVDPNIPDANSAWISFTDIEQFIADNRMTGGATGVRVFYGVHTRDNFPGDPAKNQKGLHNIIFVPTSSDTQPPTYLNSKNIVEVTTAVTEPTASLPDINSNSTGYALDNMTLCPPNCASL